MSQIWNQNPSETLGRICSLDVSCVDWLEERLPEGVLPFLSQLDSLPAVFGGEAVTVGGFLPEQRPVLWTCWVDCPYQEHR